MVSQNCVRLFVMLGLLAVAGMLLPACSPRNLRRAVKAGVAVAGANSDGEESSLDECDAQYIATGEALSAYYQANGSYPESLNALVPAHLESAPLCDGEPFGYNPVEGIVYYSNEGPAPKDYLLMEEISAAITRYGTATGYYPNTLEELYPTYMSLPPVTSNGTPFTYNNQTGEFEHPLAAFAY